MGKAIENPYSKRATAARSPTRSGRGLDWGKRMSDNVALALIVYTALQIFVTVEALEQGMSSILPYLALVLLVAGIIPACRWFEKRWDGVGATQAADPALAGAYRRDQALLWAMAIGLPFAIAFAARAIS